MSDNEDHRSDKPRKWSGPSPGIEALKSSFYTYGTNDQSARFVKTTRSIAEYVGREMDKEMWTLVLERKETEFKEPRDPGSRATKGQLEKYKMELRIYLEDGKRYQRQKGRVFLIILGQCTAAMKNKLEGLPEYKELEKNDDVKGLLEKIKALVYSTDNVRFEYWNMMVAMKKLHLLNQGPKETMANYCARFLAQVDVTEEEWGPLTPARKRETIPEEEETQDELTAEEKEARKEARAEKIKQCQLAEQAARDQYKAVLLLAGADRTQFRDATDDLSNGHLNGTMTFPPDVPGMLNYLNNHRGGNESNRKVEDIGDGIGDTSFHQIPSQPRSQNRKQGKKGKRVKFCSNCGKKGHKAHQCPEDSEDADDNSSDGNKSSKSGKMRTTWNGDPIVAQRTNYKRRGKNFTQLAFG